MRTPAQELRRQRRRRAEQHHQEPAVTLEIADERDITLRLVVHRGPRDGFRLLQDLPQLLGQRKVVMHTGNALHGPAISQGEPAAIDVLQHADMRCAVPGDRNLVIIRQAGRHRLAPQHFALELAVGKSVNRIELIERGRDVRFRRRDEFQQRLGIIGGDLRVGQRGTQCGRMRRHCQPAFAIDAQRFALNAAEALQEKLAARCLR